MTLKKLNPLGIAHYLVPLAVFVLVGVGGGAYLIKSHAATPTVIGSTIYENQTINTGQSLVSTSNGFNLLMQPDGNVVLRTSAGLIIWSNGKYGTGTNNYLKLLPNGDLVEYNGSTVVWSNGVISVPQTPGRWPFVEVQPDGNVVERDYDNGNTNPPIPWSTGTYTQALSATSGFYSNSPGIGHQSGVPCPDVVGAGSFTATDRCSNAQSGNTYLWYGPYLNEPGPLYKFNAYMYFYWTTPAPNEQVIFPGNNNTFIWSVTENNGATVLATERANSNGCTSATDCSISGTFIEPVKNLEIRASNVCPSGCGGDVLHIEETAVYTP